MKRILTSLVVLFSIIPCYGQDDMSLHEYQSYYDLGSDAFQNNNYESALFWYQKSLDYAKTKFGESHITVAQPLFGIGLVLAALEELPDAIISMRYSLQILLSYGDKAKAIITFYLEPYTLLIEEAESKLFGKDHPAYATALYDLATFYYKVYDYTQAIEFHKRALEIRKNALGDEHPDYATSLNSLAVCYSKIGNYSQAIELHKQALVIRKNALGEEHPNYATSLNNLAVCYSNIGNYLKAIELNKRALEILKNTLGENHPNYAWLLNSLAVCYNKIGNYSQAIELHKQALEIRKNALGEEHPDYATSLNNLAACYINIGKYLQAIELNKRALEIRKNALGDEHPDYATSLNNLAACYGHIGSISEAIELNKQALEILKNILGEEHPAYATSLTNLATHYYDIRNYLQAIELNKQALEIYKTVLGVNHPNQTLPLNNLAGCYQEIGDYQKAIELTMQALEIGKNTLGEKHPYCISSYSNLCITYYLSKQYRYIPTIWEEFYRNIKNSSLSQFKVLTSAQRQIYWEDRIAPYIVMQNNLHARVLFDDKLSMGLSYNSLLFTKGAILSSDIEFDKIIRESGDMALLEKFEELRTTRAILNTYYNKPIVERPEGEVERLEARAEVLERDLVAGSKEYADFTRRLEIEWQDVQATLGDKDVAIEILAADEYFNEGTLPYYAALVLRKGWDAPKFVELCGAEELQAYFNSENGLAMMYSEANSSKLYDLIWGKLAEHINEGDNVYFSPGGLLHQVNVELLQDTDGRLANEKYNLHRVSSTRELCFEKPKIAHSEAVLYGGLRYDLDSTTMIAQSRAVRPEEEFYAMRGLQLDSLRGELIYLSASKTEIEEISKQMNQHGINTTLYVEQIGNEESFKALSGKRTPIIHLATHGFFFKDEEAKVKPFFRMMSMEQERPRPDNSLRRSGLAFAGAQKVWDGEEIPKGIDDGVMLAQEIATMDLTGTDLVVLSACETGLGEITSEGVFGLQRAFKKAGVQTLIMSLWKVDDGATSLFMQTFYKHWLEGRTKHEAFTLAQKTVRENEDYSNPYYWAGFIMLD